MGQILKAICLSLLGLSAAAAQAPSSTLDEALLSGCEAAARQAKGRSAESAGGPVRAAISSLTALGVFESDEFAGVSIGFCPLRAAGGPVGTTACAEDLILLDDKYRHDDQQLPLISTLAHEMKHVLQHREQRAAWGPGYCASARYLGDRDALEAEAGAFGDAVAALAHLGRPVAVENACNRTIRIYLDGDAMAQDAQPSGGLIEIDAKATAPTERTTRSRHVRFYAETASAPLRRWENPNAMTAHRIEGRTRGLVDAVLASAARIDGPFVLRVTCGARAAD